MPDGDGTALHASLLESALSYGRLGWRVVPLHNPVSGGGCSCGRPECEAIGKHPRLKDWPKKATADLGAITVWWDRWPEANVGVALGIESGLIDIETDSPEEEADLLRLFGGEPAPTCCYQSGRREFAAKHWLYEWRDDLPGGAVIHFGKLGVRTGNDKKGAQSVFPPSLHASGNRYQWIVTPEDCPPSRLPDEVRARLWNQGGEPLFADGSHDGKPLEYWEKILAGVGEGQRNKAMTSYAGWLFRTAGNLADKPTIDVAWGTFRAVNLRHKPPLDEKELRTIFLSVLKAEQARRLAEEVESITMPRADKQIEKRKPPESMRLVIVESDPPRYKLYAPQFEKAEGGFILLTAEQMTSGRQIKIEALKQAAYPLPGAWEKAWKAKDGMYERLVLNADREASEPEDVRPSVIAERLLSQLAKARPLPDGEGPPENGRPCRLPNGDIVFGFTRVWEEMSYGADKVSRHELAAMLKKIGARWAEHKTMKRLTATARQRLKDLAEGLTDIRLDSALREGNEGNTI